MAEKTEDFHEQTMRYVENAIRDIAMLIPESKDEEYVCALEALHNLTKALGHHYGIF